MDDLLATIATVAVDGRPRFTSGVIHGCVDGNDLPAYLQEVTLLHALRFLREWVVDTKQDQTLLQHTTLRAGSALAHYQISKWMKGEGCALTSPAASGSLDEITTLPQRLTVDIAYLPFFMPDSFEEERMSGMIRTHLGQAEHLREAVLPQQTQAWGDSIAQVPWAAEELKDKIRGQREYDEYEVLQALAELGSVSASILVFLDLTREIVALAFERLHEDPQRNTIPHLQCR